MNNYEPQSAGIHSQRRFKRGEKIKLARSLLIMAKQIDAGGCNYVQKIDIAKNLLKTALLSEEEGSEMDSATYDKALENVKRTYEPKIKSLLRKMQFEFKEAGGETTAIDEITDEEYSWSFGITLPDGKMVDVSLTISEAKTYGDELGGINFSLHIVEVGGKILGGFTPYNYSSDVWVDVTADQAVEDRWQEFKMGCEPAVVVETVLRKAKTASKKKTADLEDEEEMGLVLAKLLKLRPVGGTGRYETAVGTKTAVGLYQTVKRLFDVGMRAFKDLIEKEDWAKLDYSFLSSKKVSSRKTAIEGEAKIGRAILTTNHAASSYGKPVLVLDGEVYGPDDTMEGFPAGSVVSTADDVYRRMPEKTIKLLCAWLEQSPTHGKRWVETVLRAQSAPEAEFPDEGVGSHPNKVAEALLSSLKARDMWTRSEVAIFSSFVAKEMMKRGVEKISKQKLFRVLRGNRKKTGVQSKEKRVEFIK